MARPRKNIDPGPGDTSKEAFSSPGGATVAPWPSPTVAPLGAWNGERLGPVGDILGLTPPGYELSPLRGWGNTDGWARPTELSEGSS